MSRKHEPTKVGFLTQPKSYIESDFDFCKKMGHIRSGPNLFTMGNNPNLDNKSAPTLFIFPTISCLVLALQ